MLAHIHSYAMQWDNPQANALTHSLLELPAQPPYLVITIQTYAVTMNAVMHVMPYLSLLFPTPTFYAHVILLLLSLQRSNAASLGVFDTCVQSLICILLLCRRVHIQRRL